MVLVVVCVVPTADAAFAAMVIVAAFVLPAADVDIILVAVALFVVDVDMILVAVALFVVDVAANDDDDVVHLVLVCAVVWFCCF